VSTIKSSAENLTLNADGANNDIIFQSNGSNVATLDQAGLLTATTFAGSGASLTALPSAQLTGALPAISGASLTGLSSGLSEADDWRITTDASANGVLTLTANWERCHLYGIGASQLGTGMTESSGVFTFPSTGFWRVDYQFRCNAISNDIRYIHFQIAVSTDTGSNFYNAAEGAVHIDDFISGTEYSSSAVSTLIDVTNTSTFQVRFGLISSASVVIDGHTDSKETGVSFTKLGDT